MTLRPTQFRIYFMTLLILVQPMLITGMANAPVGEMADLCTCPPDRCMCDHCSMHQPAPAFTGSHTLCGCQLKNEPPALPEKPVWHYSGVDYKFLPQSLQWQNPLLANIFFLRLFSPSQAIVLEPPDPPPRLFAA